MHTANRVIIILGAVLWIWLFVVVILLTWTAPERGAQWVVDLGNFLRGHTDTLSRVVFSLALAILVLLALALIIAELAPSPTQGGTVRVSNVKAGQAMLGTDVVAQRLERDLLALDHVNDAKAKVQGRGKGVDVGLDLGVDPDVNLAEVSEKAAAVVRDSVENRMGIALHAPPKVNLRYQAGNSMPGPVETATTEDRRPPGGPA